MDLKPLSQRTDSDEGRWRAVISRDVAADGAFVYAVRSTGVYCRPPCASRRPRREHVTFFDTAADAERAGFRACRRCRPDADPAQASWTQKVQRACAYLATVDRRVTLAALARRLGGSPYHLQRNFKRIVGVSPKEYAEACRLRNVRRELRRSSSITGAMVDVGRLSSSGFYDRVAPKLGMTPTAYRRGGAATRIRYTIVDSPLGRLLVAATARGVCSIAMAASDVELERALSAEYPAATIEPDRGQLAIWTRAVLELTAGRRPKVELPLDVQATAFQWQVWQALSVIPSGETRTYQEVAQAIGRPRAARAVARACATNPVAMAIPCHRVVPAAGGTGGYRWGIARKQQLLDIERRG